MKMEAVFHVDTADGAVFSLALGNIANYLAALPDAARRVTLLANGKAVVLFRQGGHPEENALRELLDRGVTVAVCANALKKNGMDRSELPEGCTVVPAGIVELVRLQNEGYAYIKP